MTTRPFSLSTLRAVGTAQNGPVDLSGGPVGSLGGSVNLSGPHGGIPTLPGDMLLLSVFTNFSGSGQTLTITGRYVDLQGNARVFSQTFNITLEFEIQTFSLAAPGGWLQCVTLQWDVGGAIDQSGNMCWGSVGLAAQGQTIPYLMLIGDYLTPLGTSSWPGRGPTNPLEGNGTPWELGVSYNAALHRVQVTVDAGIMWRLDYIAMQVTGAANVARDWVATYSATFVPPSIFGWQSHAYYTGAATGTFNFNWDSFCSELQNGVTVNHGVIPRPLFMHGNGTLTIVPVGGLPVGDSVTAVTLGMTQWFEPNFVD